MYCIVNILIVILRTQAARTNVFIIDEFNFQNTTDSLGSHLSPLELLRASCKPE